jgi:hypothetical protein
MIESHRAGQLDERAFGGTVGSQTGRADQAHIGGDINDAATRLNQVRQGEFAHIKSAFDIGIEGVVPIFMSGLEDRAITQNNPGIVDQDVEALMAGYRLLNNTPALVRLADIEGKEVSRATPFPNGLNDGLSPFSAAGSDDDPRAFMGEQQGGGLADAGIPAGNDGNFILKTHG